MIKSKFELFVLLIERFFCVFVQSVKQMNKSIDRKYVIETGGKSKDGK